jgi:hypothetical protein
MPLNLNIFPLQSHHPRRTRILTIMDYNCIYFKPGANHTNGIIVIEPEFDIGEE